MASMAGVESGAAVRLAGVAREQGLPSLAERLALLPDGVAGVLRSVEQQLEELEQRPRGAAEAAAQHLLDAGGKRVRPIVCLLAAEACAPGRRPAVLGELALASELIHAASLLHDDVIDLGEWRRGRPSARLVYGNAASVLGGNLLLVEALQRVGRSGVPGLTEETHRLLHRMIDAESCQLALRGRLDVAERDYLEVVEGKTASVFAWSAGAGARAVGASREMIEALELFGHELGVVFQLVDDLLDLAADPAVIGKAVLQDLETGVLTYPLIHAGRRAPLELRLLLGPRPSGERELGAAVRELAERTGGIRATRSEISRRTERARFALAAVPLGPACETLDALAGRLSARAA
jgi:octaprenyl-diphosphate synthase